MNPIKINPYRPILCQHIGQFIARYFKYQLFFAACDMGERFSHIVSAGGKKRDIGRYLG